MKRIPNLPWCEIIGPPFHQMLNRFLHRRGKNWAYVNTLCAPCFFRISLNVIMSRSQQIYISIAKLFSIFFSFVSTHNLVDVVNQLWLLRRFLQVHLNFLRAMFLSCLLWSMLFSITLTHCSINFRTSSVVLRL